MFKNRQEAGKLLADKLARYRDREDAIVVGLPRGGVPVAFEIASNLHLPLDIVCPRKIGAPGNKEFAIGAITETGEGLIDHATVEMLGISPRYIEEEIAKEKMEAASRLKKYRNNRKERNFAKKTVLIVDDGLATGATMKAAIRSIRSAGASTIVAAVPVSPQDALQEIKALADDVVCLSIPYLFQAVGQFYEDFRPTTDQEVIALMQKSLSDI